jgi:hypothetical protein
MSVNETTSERIARIASQGLFNPEALTLAEIKTVCASTLTQIADQTLFFETAYGAFLLDAAISDALIVPELGASRG